MFKHYFLNSIVAAAALTLASAFSLGPAMASDKNQEAQFVRAISAQTLTASGGATPQYPASGNIIAGSGFQLLPGVARSTDGQTLAVDWVLATIGGSGPNVRLDFLYCIDPNGIPTAWATDASATQSITVTSTSGGQSIIAPKAGAGYMLVRAVNLDSAHGATVTAVNVGSY